MADENCNQYVRMIDTLIVVPVNIDKMFLHFFEALVIIHEKKMRSNEKDV